MGKIDHAVGDRLMATQMNDVGEELNDLQSNLSVIDSSKHWEYIGSAGFSASGSSSEVVTTITGVPTDTRFIVINYVCSRYDTSQQGQMVLDTVNITVVTFQHSTIYAGDNYVAFQASISGSTLTLQVSSRSSAVLSEYGTAYYYT